MSKCKICGKDGFHKLSCTTQKATNIKNGNVNIKCDYCGGCGYHKMSCTTQKVTVFIPTLEGDEAEDFIRKADNTKKGSIDWSKQIEDCKKILEKSEIPIYLAANNHRNS